MFLGAKVDGVEETAAILQIDLTSADIPCTFSFQP
jgi:hypothetical protein